MSKVPKLRFKEFSGEWEELKIGNKCSLVSGQHLGPNEYTLFEDGIPYFSGPSDYTNDYKQLSKWTTLDTKTAIANDILITVKGSGVGELFYLNLERIAIGRQIMAIRAKDSSSLFMFQMLNLKKALFEALASGNMIPGLSRPDILQIKDYFPSISEQQKIASFLSVVDTKIDQLTRKKELLEQYKKGLMQKIFSQELRFKAEDGSEFPEWEEKKLGEIAIRKTLKNKENAFNFVLTNSATQGIVSQQDYFDKDIANQNNLEGYYIVDVDDFVYNPRISVSAPVGPIKRNKLAKGVMSPLYTVFAFSNVNLSYMEYYFDTPNWHEYMNSIANFGARHDRMNVTNKDFMEMPLLLPTMEEQTKIANFLSAIDTKIDLVAKQLDEAKNFKKGLLQQMFV